MKGLFILGVALEHLFAVPEEDEHVEGDCNNGDADIHGGAGCRVADEEREELLNGSFHGRHGDESGKALGGSHRGGGGGDKTGDEGRRDQENGLHDRADDAHADDLAARDDQEGGGEAGDDDRAERKNAVEDFADLFRHPGSGDGGEEQGLEKEDGGKDVGACPDLGAACNEGPVEADVERAALEPLAVVCEIGDALREGLNGLDPMMLNSSRQVAAVNASVKI